MVNMFNVRAYLLLLWVAVGAVLAVGASTDPARASSTQAGDQRNGRITYQAYPNDFPEVYTVGRNDGRERLTFNKTFDSGPAWSLTGRRKIAYMHFDGNDVEIYIMRADGTNKRQVTDNETNELHPTWSPSGRRLAFAGDGDGSDLEIFTIRLDGSGLRQLTDNQVTDLHPDWSPTGHRIAYDHVGDADPEIYSIRPDGTGGRRVTHNQGLDQDPSFSPSGRRIAYTSCNQDADVCQISIKRISGGERRKVTRNAEDHQGATWSPNGKRIAYTESNNAGGSDIYTIRVNGSDRRRITHSPTLTEENPDWAVRRGA